MTPEEKKSDLQRHKALVIATLDYLLEHFAGSIVYDGRDPAKEYFEQQKLQTEKYFKQRRLDRLQQQLRRLTEGLRIVTDLQFTTYIKERTGYDLDIFAQVRSRVEGLLAQQQIHTEAEIHDVSLMLNVYQKTAADPEMVDLLKSLLAEFYKRAAKPSTSTPSGKSKKGYSEIIKKVERDGIEEVTIRVSTGPKPAHLQEAVSPDGKRRLITEWSDGKHASTYVTILFATEGGAIYGTNSIHPDIKAYWKDNHTVVVGTKKEYLAGIRYKQVRNFEDIITIEYIEH